MKKNYLNRVRILFKIITSNATLYKKIFYYLKRGEFKYLISKSKNKLKTILKRTEDNLFTYKKSFEPFSRENYSLNDITIDIIIPVYNGYEFLTPLFDSIERNTTTAHRLIVVNDCSPDERVKPLLLKRLEKHSTAIFIDHEINLGFVKSVNEAYSHTNNHFLILNTDTEVPEFWVERLMYPIVNMDKVASTTPFTNSGQIASFPNFIADNNIFEEMSVDALDSLFRRVKPDGYYTQIPTGVGFCMGVNYDLIQDIGFFVEEEFGRGYGEENDWCQRAIQNGYKNLMVPNLFVYHKHGGSFSAEDKKRLMKENAVKLLHKHPNYDKDVQAYVQADPHQHLRQILTLVASSQTNEGVHLVIDQALGGGANLYTKELLERYKQEEKKILHLIYDFYAGSYILSFDYKEYQFSFAIDDLETLEGLLSEIRFAEVFLNNIVSFQNIYGLIDIVEKIVESKELKLLIPIHDYHTLCPNYTLLNTQSEFCEIPTDMQRCHTCMQTNQLEWRTFVNEEIDIEVWRKEWAKLLNRADKIICFSHSSKSILEKAYTSLGEESIEVVPHQVPSLPVVNKEKRSDKKEITIGVLGAINHAKGAGVLQELVKTIEEQSLPIKVTLIGEISENIHSKIFKTTGRYDRDKLPSIVINEDIDIFLIPSICPETFSYTTQEIIMMQMPLMVFDIGAPAERVREYKYGVVLEKNYIESIISHTLH